MNALAYVSTLLNLLPLALRGVTAAVDALQRGRAAVARMQAEARDPTPAEWDELNAMTAVLRDRLHSDER